MQIKKADRQVAVTESPESSKKAESSSNDKSRSSKGIAEAESKFESSKQNSLFQDIKYPAPHQSHSRTTANSGPQEQASGNQAITDGTSNTILIGESSTTPPADDQQADPSQSGAITDGTSNTILIGEQPPTDESGQPPAENSGGSTTGISDGTSNTILFGESGENPPVDDQQADSSRSGNSTGAITDGTSNTILIGESSSENSTSSDEHKTRGDRKGRS